MGYTTIQISSDMRQRLASLRGHRRDTYEDVLNALLDLIPSGDDEGEYTEEFRASLIRSRLDLKHGRAYTMEETRERLGLKK
jgi:hypothetical protein